MVRKGLKGGFNDRAGLLNTAGLAGDRRVCVGKESIRKPVDERKEDFALAGEMKIDAALGAAGGMGDVVDARAVIARVGKDLRGGFKDALACGGLAAV